MYNKYVLYQNCRNFQYCPWSPQTAQKSKIWCHQKPLLQDWVYLNWGAHQIRNELWSWRPFRNMYLHVDRRYLR